MSFYDQKDFEKQIPLKNGQTLLLRRPVRSDAPQMLKYLDMVSGESDNLLCGAGEFKFTLEQEYDYIENVNSKDSSLMLLGFVGDKLASIVDIRGELPPRIAHNCELGISVRKKYWRLGIGSAMMGELIAFAKAHPVIRVVHLGVKAENMNARALYEKFGFAQTGVRRGFFKIRGEYYDEVLMDLMLD